jgi:secernin
VRASCDSIVALGDAAHAHPTIFAKNSDRPAGECQPLVQVGAADHGGGGRLDCQYVSIPQVAHTYAFVGSRPYWLWGVEHGVNEHGVAIGNHTIFTKDPVADTGLLGMDLVRLGLERGVSAREATDVVIDLIERYGQGGSGYADVAWPYHNSFLIADAGEAFLLEASARHWALRDVAGGASASNHVTIATDWTRTSADCDRHAREQGWWSVAGRLDFAAAYRDTSVVPPVVSSARYRATCEALAQRDWCFDVAAAKRLMRDHNGREPYAPDASAADERTYSVCMHADPVGSTTASMVVELTSVPASTPLWVAFCNPCVAPYLPVFLGGRLPDDLIRGGAEPTGGSAWWRFKRVLAAAERDWTRTAPLIRDVWRGFEGEIAREIGDSPANSPAASCAALTDSMARVWGSACARLDEIESRLQIGAAT